MERSQQPGDAEKQSGFILVSVLWTLALIGLIATTLVKSVNLDIRAKANLIQQAQAATLADGIARVTAHDLATGRRQLAEKTRLCRVGDYAVEIEVIDQAGLVDINAAPEELLLALLMGLGQPFDEARRLAAAIADFRAPAQPAQTGPDSRAYQQAGLPHGPKRAAFETVSELDQVIGMTAGLLERLLPLVTVHSRSRGIDPAAASAAVGAALTGPRPGVASNSGSGSAVPAEFISRRRITRSFGISVSAAHPGGTRAGRRSVLELTPTQPTGFILRAWTRHQPPVTTAVQSALPNCTDGQP